MIFLQRRAGFTLLELRVATSIGLVLAGLLLAIVNHTLGLWQRQRGAVDTAAQARLVLDFLERDLQGARSVGVIAEHLETGITEIARPVGVVCAITPSTNPAATPANKIINALKGRNAVIVAPSPKGWSTCERLLRSGAEVVITITDDGRGVDRDRVRAKAEEKAVLKG